MSDMQACIQKLSDKFDQIAADAIITKEEKEAYARQVSEEKLNIVKLHGDSIDAVKADYEKQVEKIKRNCAKVVIGFLGTCAFITLVILWNAGIATNVIITYMSSWGGVITSAVLGFVNNGYLQGSGWVFLANFMAKIFPKKEDLPKTKEDTTKAIEQAANDAVAAVVPDNVTPPVVTSPPTKAPA